MKTKTSEKTYSIELIEEELIDRLKELKAMIPDQERNNFLDELFSHYLKSTDSTHEQLSTEFEFMAKLKSILDEIL